MATEEVGIRLTLAGRREAAAGLQETEKGLDRVGEAAEDAGNKAEVSGRKFDRTRGILGALGRGVVTGVKVLGVLGGAAAAVGIKTAAAMETAKIGFTTMLGSGKKAKVFLSDLAKFAEKTPFEFPELQTAASSLISAGINADKVIPIMTTLGDVTAGMGTGSEGIKRATVALQQMNAAGRITGEDLNQLRDAGIPVYDLLAAATGRSKKAVTELAQEGKLGATDLAAMMKALETGKGLEKFNGLMDKQSKSLSGTWSTLKDSINMGLANAIKPALPLVKDLVSFAADLSEKAMPKIKQGVKGTVDAIKTFAASDRAASMMQKLRDGFKTAAGAIVAFVAAVKTGGMKDALAGLSAPDAEKGASGIASSLGKIGTKISDIDWGAVKEGLGEGVADTISVFGVAIGFAADHIDDFAKYLPLLVAGLVAYKAAQALGNLAALAAVPITVLQIVSNLSLASSNRALAAATTTATVAQRGLNLAMLMNPVGAVVLAIVALIGIFYLLWTRCDTFREILTLVWDNLLKPFAVWIGDNLVKALVWVASGLLGMAANGVMAFRLLVTAAFRAFDGILGAAEAGLGWIPGIGDKIKGARAAFDRFGDGVIDKLQKVENKIRQTQAAVDGLAKDRKGSVTVTTFFETRNAVKERQGDEAFAPRANGGPVKAGMSYIVGERRPELFRPSVDGVIMPRVPAGFGIPAPRASSPRVEQAMPSVDDVRPPTVADVPVAPTARFRSSQMPKGDTYVYLDGKQIAKNTVDHVGAKLVRT